MKPWVGVAFCCLVFSTIAAAENDSRNVEDDSGESIEEQDQPTPISKTTLAPKQPPTCGVQCENTFAKTTSTPVSDELKSCESGCRLLSIVDAVSWDPFRGKENDAASSFKSCQKSCESSYKEEVRSSACKKGCEYQMPFITNRKKTLIAPASSLMGGNSFGFSLPRIRIGIPSSFRNLGFPDMFGEEPEHGSETPVSDASLSDGGIGGLFKRLHEQMSSMMDGMLKQAQEASGGEDGEGGPRGKMIVIKSGPGYHQEKTYDFGPNGVQTRTETRGNLNEAQGDMMSHANPLERFFNKDEVEVMSHPRERTLDQPKNPFKNSFIETLVGRNSDKPSATVHGFDYDGPRLPEEGLKTGHHGREYVRLVSREHICHQRRENMKWSDWVNCLHIRMGLPRWLTACTISLGIVFIIWLCLVIPHNAPKQRILNKYSAKELEANGIISVDKSHLSDLARPPSYDAKMDLPPAYQDLGPLCVDVPDVHAVADKKKEEGQA